MIDRDLVPEVELAIEAREAVRVWRELRTVILGWGGIRPGPDHGPETIPPPLRRRNGTPPDELARLVADLGELAVEDGDQLVELVGRVYARYLELRGVDVDPWRRRALDALEELRRRRRPWTAEELRQLAGAPSAPNAVGAIVRALRQRGLIRPAGTANATRREARGRLVRRWEVAA